MNVESMAFGVASTPSEARCPLYRICRAAYPSGAQGDGRTVLREDARPNVYRRGMTFKRVSRLCALVLPLAMACGESDSGNNDESTTNQEASTGTSESTASDTTETTTSASETTGTGTDETTGTGTTDTTAGFVPDMSVEAMCDIWNFMDCPEGQKCIPYASSNSSWDALKCIDIADPAGTLGDECSAPLGGAGGQDDCDNGYFCYYVDSDTLIGTCIAHCTGSPESPVCPAETICTIVNDGVLTLCRPTCDPVAQDCEPAGSGCYQATGGNGFTCIIDASGDGGVYGDVCEFINSCDPGLACVNAEGVPGCTGSGCCSPWCDTSAANECPDAAQGQTCVPWFETPVPGYETVGVCSLPTPDQSPAEFSSKLKARDEVAE